MDLHGSITNSTALNLFQGWLQPHASGIAHAVKTNIKLICPGILPGHHSLPSLSIHSPTVSGFCFDRLLVYIWIIQYLSINIVYCH